MRDGPWKLLAKLDGGAFPKIANVHDGNVAAVRAARLTDIQLFRVVDDVAEQVDVPIKNAQGRTASGTAPSAPSKARWP